MLQLNLIWCSIVLISSSPFQMVHHGQDSTIVAFDVKVSNVDDGLCGRTFVSEMENSFLMSGQYWQASGADSSLSYPHLFAS